jgi:dTDP-4-dehydrorhamnose reductase
MKIVLFGKNGQLGWELQRTLAPLGKVISFDFPQVDLCHPEQARQVLRQEKPTLIVNASAYTAVDRAESEPEKAFAVNQDAPRVMAEEAKHLGAAFIHFSTDYVFDGKKSTPYLEEDQPYPLSIYGKSKWEGEKAVLENDGCSLILRTAWVYSLRGDTFVNKVLGWARKQTSMRVVNDQISNPTWARFLAEITAQVVAMGKPDFPTWLEKYKGLYHLAGSGHASRLEWAREILAADPHIEEQTVRQLDAARSSDFPTPAERPLFSVLNCERFTQTFGLHLPPWQEALRLAMEK